MRPSDWVTGGGRRHLRGHQDVYVRVMSSDDSAGWRPGDSARFVRRTSWSIGPNESAIRSLSSPRNVWRTSRGEQRDDPVHPEDRRLRLLHPMGRGRWKANEEQTDVLHRVGTNASSDDTRVSAEDGGWNASAVLQIHQIHRDR